MYATTFILPQKEIVIKFFEKEPEEKGVAKLPNDSRYMLQPYCMTNILGNRLAIFPLLKTMQIDSSHVSQLSAGLEKEGCLFDDAKFDNVGLTEFGLPYVIDEDAVLITQGKLKGDSSKRESQWQMIKPYFETDEKFDPEKSGWDFDPVFLEKMTTLSPQPLSASLLKTPSHSPDVAKVF